MQKPKVCKYYVERKKRHCKFDVAKGMEYCRVHGGDSDDRMLCPFQKDTFIKTSQYEAHLKICPRLKDKLKQEKEEWFTKNVNTVQNSTPMVQECSIRQLVLQEGFGSFVPKLLSAFFKVFDKEPHGAWYYIDLTKQIFDQPKSTDRDQVQCDLILSLLLKYKLKSLDNIYVQFGAGKGLLSSTICKEFKEGQSKHVLLEMESRRNKADLHHRDNPFFQRYRSNVGDFELKKIKTIMMDQIKSKAKHNEQEVLKLQKELQWCGLVGVCKHMCGMATDLSISALKNASAEIPVYGTVMATCCHHKCSYQTFENVKFFQDLGFSPSQTSMIFKVSSWGVMRTKEPLPQPTPTVQQFLQLFRKEKGSKFDEPQRQIVGKACKRLIDKARAQLMAQFKLRVEFVKYCDYDITPENFALICFK